QQRRQVTADSNSRELRAALEQTADSLADEVVILREHKPDRHGERIRPDGPRKRCANIPFKRLAGTVGARPRASYLRRNDYWTNRCRHVNIVTYRLRVRSPTQRGADRCGRFSSEVQLRCWSSHSRAAGAAGNPAHRRRTSSGSPTSIRSIRSRRTFTSRWRSTTST